MSNKYKQVMISFANDDEKEKNLSDKFVRDSEENHRSLSAQAKFIIEQYYAGK